MKDDPNMPVIPLPNPGEGGPVADLNTPVIPLPNPGEGGPVADLNTPVIPLPNPGEGGPVADLNTPVIPLPNPGQGGPVAGGGGIFFPFRPQTARVRFLHAAYGYPPFRILINQSQAVSWLNYATLSSYSRVPAGYQTVTVTGTDGYIYIQKTLPFQRDTASTVAVINTPGGLDLLQIPDTCCPPGGRFANFRVSNLALNSGALDVLLADGRVVYADVRFKETTSFKRMAPGAYQFFFAQTDLTPMPDWQDIETLDSAFVGLQATPDTVATLYLNAASGNTYTVFLLGGGNNTVQTMVVTD